MRVTGERVVCGGHSGAGPGRGSSDWFRWSGFLRRADRVTLRADLVAGLTVAVGATGIAAPLLRRFAPRLPAALIVVVALTTVSAIVAFGGRASRS